MRSKGGMYPKSPVTYIDSNAEWVNYIDNINVWSDTLSFGKTVAYRDDGYMKNYEVKMGLHSGKVYGENDVTIWGSYDHLNDGPLIALDTFNSKHQKYFITDEFDPSSKNWRYDVTTYFPDSIIGLAPGPVRADDGIFMAEDTDRTNLYVVFNTYVWCFNKASHQLLWTKRLKGIKYLEAIVPFNNFLLLF